MAFRMYKRGEIWYAQVPVPESVQSVIGKHNYQKSTGHRDKRLASIEAQRLAVQWLEEIEEAKRNPDSVSSRIVALKRRHLEDEVNKKYWDYQLDPLGKEAPRGWTEAELDLDEYLEELRCTLKPSKFQYYIDIYTGKTGVPIGVFVKTWLNAEYSRAKERTKYEAERCMHRMATTFPTLSDLTAAKRKAWLLSETRNIRTVQKDLNFLRRYYDFLLDTYRLPSSCSDVNPFKNVSLPKSLKPTGETNRRAFELHEVKHLLANCNDPEVTRFVKIAVYTGMRLTEIGQLTHRSLITKDGFFCIKVTDEAKTKASSSRLIPVTLSGEVMNLTNEPSDSSAVGKRFGRLKSKLGYDQSAVFHSLRKTFATICEQSGIPEGVAADILGHEKQTLSYGLYSGGTSLEQRLDAMKKVQTRIDNALEGM